MNTGLKGKVVLLAGASEGMGRATAQCFAEEGCILAICSRTEEKIQDAAAEIRKSTGAEVFAQQLDVSYGAGVEKFVADIVKKYGRVDVCVANAAGPRALGRSGPRSPARPRRSGEPRRCRRGRGPGGAQAI